jgi:DNA-directed RNA polymerase alpha subunit
MQKDEARLVIKTIDHLHRHIENSDLLSKHKICEWLEEARYLVLNEADQFIASLDTRTQNALHRSGIFHFEDLLLRTRTEIKDIVHLGERSIEKLEYLMSLRGGTFKIEQNTQTLEGAK